MTTYRAIASTETDPEAPITSTLMKALQQNVLAISEADSSAPSTLFPSVLLGTLTTTSGTTQTLSSLVLTPYRFIEIELNNVQLTQSISAAIAFTIAGCTVWTTSSTTQTVRGNSRIALATGIGWSAIAHGFSAAPSSVVSQSYNLRTSLSTASTSISFTTTAQAFAAGTINVYGVK